MNESIRKFLFCLLPFLSGFIFKLYIALPNWKFSYLGISFPELIYSFVSLIMLILFYHIFAKSIWFNNVNLNAFWFDFKIAQVTPYIIIFPYILSIIILPFTSGSISAFLRTCILGVVIEEMLARGIFIKYPTMSNKEFLIWATISNCSFALNHWLYDHDYINLPLLDQTEKFLMHFGFGILLSGMIFKSKKFELPILRHSYSNISSYFWIYSPALGSLNGLLWFAFDYLNLIGLDSKKK